VNYEYNFQRIIEALSILSAGPDYQARVNLGEENVDVDGVFDFEPLDWLKGLYENNQISRSLNESILALYEDIDKYTKHMSLEEEDGLVASNNPPMSIWRKNASRLLDEMRAERAHAKTKNGGVKE
jgi:hypothetical protein